MPPKEWSGYPDPSDPDNFWIDDETGERVNAWTGERGERELYECANCGATDHPSSECPHGGHG